MGLSHGIHTISLYDDLGDKTVVQINALVADRTSFDLRQPVEGDEGDEHDNQYAAGLRSEAEIVFLDVDDVASTIQDWQSNDKKVRLAAAGASKNILWEEDTIPQIEPVTIEGAIGGRSDGYVVTMTHKTGRGSTHSVYGLTNLLAKLASRTDSWEDTGGDGEPDGYTSSFQDDTFSGDVFEGTTRSSGAPDQLRVRVDFPIENVNVILSHEFTQLHPDTNELQILFKDNVPAWDKPGTYNGAAPRALAVYDGDLYAANRGSDDVSRWDVFGTTLSTLSQTVTATGRKSVSGDTPTNVYTIELLLQRVSSISQIGTQKGRLPAFRTDGETEHINY